MKDGSPLSDGTQLSSSVVMGSGNDTLTIVSVQDGDGGGYSCNAGNGQGTTISNSSMLTVGKYSLVTQSLLPPLIKRICLVGTVSIPTQL